MEDDWIINNINLQDSNDFKELLYKSFLIISENKK
jgi:hypothetical protein